MRLWVNTDRTVLVTECNGMMEVATRDREGDIWGPPVYMTLDYDESRDMDVAAGDKDVAHESPLG